MFQATLQTAKASKLPPLRSARVDISECPALLNSRKAIELAFKEAKLTRFGEPTDVALWALDWIMARTDWTKLNLAGRDELWSTPPPPQQIRKEFIGTFDWCCHWLDEDPVDVRNIGLSHQRMFNENTTAGGVAAIYSSWMAARKDWRAKLYTLTPDKFSLMMLERRYKLWKIASEEVGQLCLI